MLRNMKTSLNIDDAVYEDARKVSQKTGRTLSDTISDWARIGRNVERSRKRKRPTLEPVDLGRSLLNIDSRSTLADILDDDRT